MHLNAVHEPAVLCNNDSGEYCDVEMKEDLDSVRVVLCSDWRLDYTCVLGGRHARGAYTWRRDGKTVAVQ